MTAVSESFRLRQPSKARIAAARAELVVTQTRVAASNTLVAEATALAARLNGHRQDNHFRQRIETLYRDAR